MQQLDQRGVIAHIVVVGRKLERARKVGEGLIEPPEPVEQIAAIGEGMRQARIERDGRVEIARAPARCDLPSISAVPRPWRASAWSGCSAIDRSKLSIAWRGGRASAGQARAIEPGFGEIRIGRDRAIEAVERKLGAAELLLRDADQIVRGGIFRIDLDRPAGESRCPR